jgi:integrase
MEELKVLISDYEGHWLYLPVLLAATCGMRRGEVCGLKWEDYSDGVLVVRRSLGESKGLFEKSTKTENIRAVPLVSLAREALDERKKEWEPYCRALGLEMGYICCHRDGSPLRPSTVSDSFRRNRFGIRFHDLRHSHATILAIRGESPEAVRQRLGHSSVQVTMDLYTHLAGAAWDPVTRWDEEWGVSHPGNDTV